MNVELRRGWLGYWDRFVGPGATRSELRLMWFAALSGAIAAVWAAASSDVSWTAWQYVLAGLLGFDLAGGVAVNASRPAKRWYHRPGQTGRHHLGFVAAHGVQIGIVAWAFRGGDWGFMAAVTMYVLLAAFVIGVVSARIQRPLAMMTVLDGLLLAFYVLSPTPGLEWFVPALVLKLLVCHLLPDDASPTSSVAGALGNL